MRDISELPGATRIWRGRRVHRERLVTWPAQDGTWHSLRDRWVPSGMARGFKRDIQTLGPFPDRETALKALRS